jgi:long-chain acyl-CoA synthetase
MIALEQILPRACVQYGDRKALYSHGRWLKFPELAERVYRLAGAFLAMGVKPGERVAVLDANSPEYVEMYYAAIHVGAVLVPLNSRLSVPELQYILLDCTPRVLIVGAAYVPLLQRLQQANVEVENAIVIGAGVDRTATYDGMLHDSAPAREPRRSRPDEISSIYYTSGTTGEPKGVCLTYSNMSASAIDVILGMGLRTDDVWLHAAPLFHLVDAWAVWAMPIIGAAQVTLQFTADAFIAVCDEAKATHVALPPTLISLLCEQLKSQPSKLGSLKQIMYGGSPMPPTLLEEAQRMLSARLTNSYGATETSGTLTLVRSTRPTPLCGAGQTVVSATVEVVDADGMTAPAGEVGEIVVSGPRVMSGYWNKPKATREAMVNGRYYSGDVGYIDGQGNLFISDRKKDMIITGGENVYSTEVESILASHPAVQECAVIGIPHEKWVEAVHAVVVLTPEGRSDADGLIAFCRGKIAPYKIPKTIEIVSGQLPRSATGKIVKHEIRSWYGNKPSSHNGPTRPNRRQTS